jgi:hypothetical protein
MRAAALTRGPAHRKERLSWAGGRYLALHGGPDPHLSSPLPPALAQAMLRILDKLVDMGDRRSAALQLSEIFKDVRL